MAKKTVDQHRSGFMVRLPEEYRPLLEQLKKQTDRTITVLVRRGVDKELRENGITPPGAESVEATLPDSPVKPGRKRKSE